MKHRHTPYNTGKVLIGMRWQPPPHKMTPEEEFIQGVLLGYPMPLFNLRRLARALFYTILFFLFLSVSLRGVSHARPPV